MAISDRLKVRRDQLAKFIDDHDTIKQFERLFDFVNAADVSLAPQVEQNTEDISINSGNISSNTEAIDAIPTDTITDAPVDGDRYVRKDADWENNEPKILHIQDQKASGTDGGTFTSGAWRTRVLNTILTNSITGASLSSNQITLLAGTYKYTVSAPAFDCNRHKSKLYNITDAADERIGTSEFSNPAGASSDSTKTFITGVLILTETKVFEIQHRCLTTSGGTNGLGVAVSFGVVEIYSDVFIEKIG